MDTELDALLSLPHEERVELLRSLLDGHQVHRPVVVAATLIRRSRSSGLAEQGM